MKQYALVRNGRIEMEGALPYFWKQSPESPQMDMLSLPKAELENLGWFEIREVNKQESFDTEIQSQISRPVILVDGRPVREWFYPFREGVVSVFLERNQRKAEELRSAALSTYSGQAMEYQLLASEAQAFMQDANPDPMDYPLLYSTINTSKSKAEQSANAKLEAAKILSKQTESIKLLAMIRSTRKYIEGKLLNETDPTKMVEIENEWNTRLQQFMENTTR